MSSTRIYIDGVTPKALARAAARAANRHYRTGKLTGRQMSAVTRRTEIKKLARLRMRTGAPLGAESGWIECIANALRVRHGMVDAAMISDEAHKIGLPPFKDGLVADAVAHIAKQAWGQYELYSPKLAGDKLQLMAIERDKAGIVKIIAIDETAKETRRRRDRERKAQQRAAKAALAGTKITKVAMAKALGISRPTLDAWIAKGIVNAETGELNFTGSVRSSLLLRSEKPTRNVKAVK